MHFKKNLTFSIYFIVGIGVILSSISGWLLYKENEKTIINEFHNDVNERAASIYREVTINFESLRSLAILFSDGTIPDFERFSFEAKNILSRYSDIQGHGWLPRVKHSERATYEAKLGQDFLNFEITEYAGEGDLVTATERQEYFPVYYIEPYIGNEAALGFDIASNTIRREALENSRDTATLQATASITLVQEIEDQKAILAFIPVYKGPKITLENRRDNLIGFISGVYRIGDIVKSSNLIGDELLGIQYLLVEKTLSSKDNIIYIHKGGGQDLISGHMMRATSSISYTKELPDIAGQIWTMIAIPSTNYIASRRNMQPLMVFVLGIICTLFFVFYVQNISKNTKELNAANKKLGFLSRTDGLTGAANRRYLDEFIDKEWLRSIRNKSSISLILIDIDFFKLYNDNYGHLEGDNVLKKVTEKLKSIVHRPGDLVARYGGEEFILVLTDTEDAEFVANSCRRLIKGLMIPHAFSEVANVVTISVGYCTVAPKKGTDPSLIIDSADKALYKAKQGGRDRVENFLFHS